MKCLLVTVLLVGAAAPLHAQDQAFARSAVTSGRETSSMTTARELYASARYDEALAVLNGMLSTDRMTPADVKVIEQYRSFCLLALGRGEEAETAITAVVNADPFYKPADDEVSPRIRSTFADVRQRLLPTIASSRYASAKAIYDRKEFAAAEQQFRQVLALLEDPQMSGRLADLRTLAAGFLELATAAAAPPPAPKPEEPPPPPPVAAPVVPQIYATGDAGVTPAVTIRQELPPVPAAITSSVREQGLLEIVIDPQGRVSAMTLRTRVHPVYDTILLNAASEWKYRPAMLNGKPVPFRKLIQFTVKK